MLDAMVGFLGTGLAALLLTLDPQQLRAMLQRPGVPVVVNVWATWCRPCVEEFPEILAFARAHRQDAKVLLISVDFASRRELVERFLAQQGVDFPTYLKEGGDEDFIATLAEAWSGSLPATFVFDRHGQLVRFFERKVTRQELEKALAEARRGKGGRR